MNRLVVCCIITKDAYCEFEVLRKSMELFHRCIWYVAADSYVFDIVNKDKDIFACKLVSDSKFMHGVKNIKNNTEFYDMLLTKFKIIKIALQENEYAIFLDTDMFFVNKIELELINIIKEKKVDIILTPHYTRDKINEDRVGFYNAGMFIVNNTELIEKWEKKCIEEENQYYEQPPLEEIVEQYRCMILPINYNIGWWRFKKEFSDFRYEQLRVENGQIMLGHLPAINFHLHTIKKLSYPNFGLELLEKIFMLKELLQKDTGVNELLTYLETEVKRDC